MAASGQPAPHGPAQSRGTDCRSGPVIVAAWIALNLLAVIQRWIRTRSSCSTWCSPRRPPTDPPSKSAAPQSRPRLADVRERGGWGQTRGTFALMLFVTGHRRVIVGHVLCGKPS